MESKNRILKVKCRMRIAEGKKWDTECGMGKEKIKYGKRKVKSRICNVERGIWNVDYGK